LLRRPGITSGKATVIAALLQPKDNDHCCDLVKKKMIIAVLGDQAEGLRVDGPRAERRHVPPLRLPAGRDWICYVGLMGAPWRPSAICD